MVCCPSCNSELVTDGQPAGQKIRCAFCAAVHLPSADSVGAESKKRTNQAAWRSLVLSILAVVILLLGVTGFFIHWTVGVAGLLLFVALSFASLYYGIRSLLKMRYDKPTFRERIAAIVGTLAGILFSIISGIGLMLAAIVLFVVLASETTRDPLVAKQWMDEVAAINLPDQFRPIRGVKIINMQRQIEYDDGDKEKQRNARIRIAFFDQALRYQTGQLKNAIYDLSLRSNLSSEPKSSENLKWLINGTETTIVHETFTARSNAEPVPPEDDFDDMLIHRYYGMLAGEDGAVGIALVYKAPPSKLDPDQVRQIFESLRLK